MQTALNFLNIDCKIIHNNINVSSIFVNKAGEWKLGGLEFSFAYEQRSQIDTLILNKLPLLSRYEQPENKTSGNNSEIWSVDSWGLGCLIWEIFNGILQNVTALKNHGKVSIFKILHACQTFGLMKTGIGIFINSDFSADRDVIFFQDT